MVLLHAHGLFLLLFNIATCVSFYIFGLEPLSLITLFLLNGINLRQMLKLNTVSPATRSLYKANYYVDNPDYIYIHSVFVKKKCFYVYVKQLHLISYVNIILGVFLGMIGKIPVWFIGLLILMHFYLLRKYKSITIFM